MKLTGTPRVLSPVLFGPDLAKIERMKGALDHNPDSGPDQAELWFGSFAGF